ncbi:MAG: hypothetical protein V1929_11125 [bacterium]
MDRVAAWPESDRADLIREAGTIRKLPSEVVEKDFWVCWGCEGLTSLHSSIGMKEAEGLPVGMSRPLRLEMAGGWYHGTARGNDGRVAYRDDVDYRCFVELLSFLPKRFGDWGQDWICHISLGAA